VGFGSRAMRVSALDAAMIPRLLRCCLVAVFCVAPLRAAELRMLAAASLVDALQEIATGYEQRSGDRLVLQFGASNLLARQIEQGAPADVFLSADEAKMDALEKRGLVLAGTRRALLSNTLAIIVPAHGAHDVQTAADLAKPGIRRVALAEPETVPAGIYARQFLEQRGIWAKVKSKIVPTENVRGVLAAVESGNADAGIVYKTDALLSRKVRVAVDVARADGPRIVYPVAVVATTRKVEAAQGFVKFLAAAEAMKIFEKFGFLRPE
jgi:molybdate transport system substrate-binding protein